MVFHLSILSRMTGRVLLSTLILFSVATASVTKSTYSSVEMDPSVSQSGAAIYPTPSTAVAKATTVTRSAQTSRVDIAPSLSHSTPTTTTRFTKETSRTLSQSVAAESTESVYPTKTPEPHHVCNTGPDFRHKSHTLIVSDHIYLDLSQPVNCSGVIKSWYYCFVVIAFRNTRAGLWPCVWRKSNSSEEGYENVGCNKFTIVPGKGDEVRCKYYYPSHVSEFLRVEEGDYIGFYIPDSGLIPALSSHVDHYQFERNETGFSPFINESELVYSSSPGRALIRAEIDSVFPSTMPTIPIETTTEPITSSQPSSLSTTALAASLVVALGVTIVLTITVIALVAYVNCRRRCCSGYEGLQAGADDMEYNDIYKFRSANHVVVGNKRTFVTLNENPAYDSISPTSLVPPGRQDWSMQDAETCSSTPRRQLEHTYESLSNYHVHATNINS